MGGAGRSQTNRKGGCEIRRQGRRRKAGRKILRETREMQAGS